MAKTTPPYCKCCATDKKTRPLMLMPFRTQNKKLPVLVCGNCDGPALRLAQEEQKRQQDQ